MPEFSKAFISHSSVDKPLVGRIAARVSAARWEIDSHTFEEGKASAAEITTALSRSDLFVLILSSSSAGSSWVSSELEIAQHLLYSRRLGGIVVFIVDETPVDVLPEWVRMYVFIRTRNEVRIANLIRSQLMQLDARKGVEEKPFVQRTALRGEMERRLADLNRPVSAVYVSGVDGIGRRAFVTNTVRSLFPGMDVTGIEVSLADGEGLLEAYRKLYFSFHNVSVADAKRFFDEVASYTSLQLVERLHEIFDMLRDQKMFVWLRFDYEILDDNGYFQSGFGDLLRGLKGNLPNIIICAKRMPKFNEQRKFGNVAFFKVGGLSRDESKLLWTFALQHLKFPDLEPKFIAFLQENVTGHPAMIWTAAEYVASSGKAATQANPRELMEMLRGLSLSLVDGLKLSDVSRRLLALFDDFGAMDPGDLLEVSGESDQVVSEAVSGLLSLGLLESEGDHLKLAGYFRNARFRKQFADAADDFLVGARQRLLALVSTYTAEDNVSLVTVDSVLTTAIAQGKSVDLFGDRALIGSHYLRVARGCYDREKYEDAVAFASEALEKGDTLTQEAKVECLRLLGMAAVRTGDGSNVTRALSELAGIGTKQANRHIHFIRGFDSRWNGDYERAVEQFREVLNITKNDTHALRELAQLLATSEDFISAEHYAREALARNPGNPFVIDILLNCIIEQRKSDPEALSDDSEVSELFADLEMADRRDRTDFSDLRLAQYYAALSDFDEAIKWAHAAVQKNPSQVRGWAMRAEIKLRMKNDAKMIHSVAEDIKQIKKMADESRGARTHSGLLAKLRIRFEIAKGNLVVAIRELDHARNVHGELRDKLTREIISEAASGGSTEPEVVAFVSRFA
ncbi:toll/interleukin-1 receptor domain-containing protein [Burkholderia vietnamiensis]|uniref:toll/interleukin-1 receptor domain-containing protein n=1 Tax=Burkholderia vietnamiensis TaxID=60552 RepID=UPI001CF11410|nr:toll/interleukin-1 receptor domain-containing protein [Burkholderia vietnamiensis]MCA8269311.1 TIR domain-containing protein [Burkholderia vietnamiensis]